MRILRVSFILFMCFFECKAQDIFNPSYNWNSTNDSVLFNSLPDSIYIPYLNKRYKNSFLLTNNLTSDYDSSSKCYSFHSNYKIREIVVRKDGGRWNALYHIIFDSIVIFYSPLDSKGRLNGISIIRFVDGTTFSCERSIYDANEIVSVLRDLAVVKTFKIENLFEKTEVLLFENGVKSKDFELSFSKGNLQNINYDLPYRVVNIRLKKKTHKFFSSPDSPSKY